MTNKRTFKLFASCRLVDGVSRATICDLQRGGIHVVPLSLYHFLTEYENKPYSEIQSTFSESDLKIIDSYYTFLIERELGFWTEEPHLFPDLSLSWESPEKINNSIIEIDKHDISVLEKIMHSLLILRCKFLEVRFYSSFSVQKLDYLLDLCFNTPIRSVSIYACYQPGTLEDDVDYLMDKYKRISTLIFHSVPEGLLADLIQNKTDPRVQFISKCIDGNSHCGIIESQLFTSKIEVFAESQQYNTCLNKKVTIDNHGNIKNCPSTKFIYGNIEKDKIEDVIEGGDFQKMWSINKDEIHTCRSCEFRHVCTDCRAFVQDPNDIYSKPLKCGYDPKSMEWKDWREIPINQDAIIHYEQDLILL
ncbi:MAG: grasp-with-spasm system SPASM domain peptide maturase [Bacteroidota bacterium]